MIDRLKWFLYRRFLLAHKVNNFWAHRSTYCDEVSVFDGCNRVEKNTRVYNSHFGRFTYVAENSVIKNSKIGAFCSIGNDVQIGGFGLHPLDRISTSPSFYSGYCQCNQTIGFDPGFVEHYPVKIGNDVWIGAGAKILDGVTIHTGAVIAANAVVTKDVLPYSIVGGVPAKLIRFRFSDRIIDELLRSKWWDWDFDKLKSSIFQQKISIEVMEKYRFFEG